MPADAANVRNHIEAVRHGAAVVYLGVVEAVEATERERDGRLLAATRVRVLFVARSPTGEVPAADMLEYPTWDDEHAPYAGDGQYRIDPGAYLALFKNSWDGGEVRYLLQGTAGELLQDLERRQSWLAGLSEEGLRREEIDEEGRRTQLELYRRLAAQLGSVNGL